MNKLILGDNLEILKTLESEIIDLIYLNLLFFSNRHYEIIWGDQGEIRSFEDQWSGGIEHYIAWLKGGGTTVAVGDRLNRQWIGIDQSVQAIKVSKMRLQKQHDLLSRSDQTQNEPGEIGKISKS